MEFTTRVLHLDGNNFERLCRLWKELLKEITLNTPAIVARNSVGDAANLQWGIDESINKPSFCYEVKNLRAACLEL